MKSSGKTDAAHSMPSFLIDILYNTSRAFTMGGTGEKARNMSVSGRHSNNLQNFMSFTITYANFVKNLSFFFFKRRIDNEKTG
ncbi:hypothetical protein [Mitsuokella multacida]|uniref:hypothetical protein n=1 Tax=Mitsuokella multacida TaxID=52226 RepID=UPI002594A928|nr:hypothetical protein [Mitsuokella multacida]